MYTPCLIKRNRTDASLDISSFHGPWLQLPPEVLESLAYSNYESPRPKPIDPAVFFDIVKIRRLVEDATDLAVRASNGTTSAGLGNSLNTGQGLLGGGSAAAFGLGLGAGGPGAKLSRERRHRMRELATQKLSRAYHLDEIAASVATMQGASSLEEVARYVLLRKATDSEHSDAKYVHFFHEKIPSRMLAQSTSLQALDEIIQSRPKDGAPLRTRAVTRMFKDDFQGAAQDLTEALTVCRCGKSQHSTANIPSEPSSTPSIAVMRHGTCRDSQRGARLEEQDQPGSLEAQLLFHRAGVYLTLACRNVHLALDDAPSVEGANLSTSKPQASYREERNTRLEARKLVRTNAKRALKDYISFLSHFEYTPGLPAEVTEEFFEKTNSIATGLGKSKKSPPVRRSLEMSGNSSLSNGSLSDSLTPYKSTHLHDDHLHGFSHSRSYTSLPSPEVFAASILFSSSPPPSLPPYPALSNALVTRKVAAQAHHSDQRHPDQQEAVTYHPLLTDALHSLLLCHSLMQTSTKELLRHAHMVARLSRICDGYPIFLASRSPSRADWIEIVQRADNWIGLQLSWEVLCAPAPLPGQASTGKKEETEEQANERQRQEIIVEALADEKVIDEASFQAAVEARQRRADAMRKESMSQPGLSPKRWAQEDGKEYTICTERAEAVARWVKEAPPVVSDPAKKKRSSRGRNHQNEARPIHQEHASLSHLKIGSEVSTADI